MLLCLCGSGLPARLLVHYFMRAPSYVIFWGFASWPAFSITLCLLGGCGGWRGKGLKDVEGRCHGGLFC